jgi:predicted ATPase
MTGPNGCGKSNLFNGFRLIRAACAGTLTHSLASEGGLESALWAGGRKTGPIRLKVGIVAEPYEYVLELGVRPESEMPLVPLDPQIKSEIVKLAGKVIVDRNRSTARMFPVQGTSVLRRDVLDSESIFAQIGDPGAFHSLCSFKELVSRWSFYHQFRTDAESGLRRPALSTFTSQLSEDGYNLGPMLRVIQHRGEFKKLKKVIRDAFPGSELVLNGSEFALEVEGIRREITPHEMSDGTLRFLCLAAVCFGPYSPPLIAFNEPEASLSPALFKPLADMLAHCSLRSQIWVTTHAEELNRALVDRLDCRPIRLDKVDGETARSGRPKGLAYSVEWDG